MKLPERVRKMAEIVGNGDRTLGVEQLFAQLPIFYRVRVHLEKLARGGDEIAASLLIDLEDLEIERIYEEAIAEGVIKTPSGSWII